MEKEISKQISLALILIIEKILKGPFQTKIKSSIFKYVRSSHTALWVSALEIIK